MAANTVLLVEGALYERAKTAVNLLRYKIDEVAVVFDRTRSGQNCQQIFGVGGACPVVGAFEDLPQADTLVVGVAPPGGRLPKEMKEVILLAIQRRMTIISGLHEFLCDDEDLRRASEKTGARLVDLRKNAERQVANRQGLRPSCLRILTVGHDCNVGKMVVSLELTRALQGSGYDAKFVATGQTGILIAGDGVPVDAVVVDFLNGAAEKLVLDNQSHEILLIEGQGSLVHPRYSPVSLGLLHGTMPDGLILCYEMGREWVYGMERIAIPALDNLRTLHEDLANVAHPCRVIGIAMNSRKFNAREAAQERAKVSELLGLPVCDVIRDGPDSLVKAIVDRKREIEK